MKEFLFFVALICIVYASNREEYSAHRLTISSNDPIEVNFIGPEVYAQISKYKVIAESEYLQKVHFHAGGSVFYFEAQLSSTQYGTNLGYFNYGQTYEQGQFTFSVIPTSFEFPINITFQALQLIPCFTASVTEPNQIIDTYYRYASEIIVSAQNSYSLTGFEMQNPFYTITNMTFFPPFEPGSEYGKMMFMFGKEETFHTVRCYDNTGEIGGIDYTIFL